MHQAAPGLGFSWAWAEGWRPVGDVFKTAQQPHLTVSRRSLSPTPRPPSERNLHSYTPAILPEGEAVLEHCLVRVV